MKVLKNKKWIIPVAATVLTLSIAGAAWAATGSSSTDTALAGTAVTAAGTVTTAAGSTSTDNGAGRGFGQQRSDETLLTGDVLAKVQAAALAKIGSDATVMRAETDADGNAKYEVHAVKADGTRVVVYVDASYNVVSVATCGAGDGNGGHGRGMMGGNSNETALTGDALTKATAAATAAAGAGSTVISATTEDPAENTGAAYEVKVKKSDGTCVEYLLDSSFKVVKTETAPMGDGGHMGGGHGRGMMNGTGTTGTAGTTATSTSSSF